MAYVAVSSVPGLHVQVLSQGGMPNSDVVRLFIYGTYTAQDFYLTAGDGAVFRPGKVRILNLSTGAVGEWYLDDTTNMTNSGFTQLSTGAKTLIAKGQAGVTLSGGKVQFAVAACCPITNNNSCVIELYRG